jgi:DNA (cytosine-5)-methyltransferase 1
VRHLGLFEGIGGFSLAARWMGWETVAWVEIDKFCQAVLKKNFPDAKGYGDIKEFDGTPYRGTIDILTGGFPCQTFSLAGLGAADMGLWNEMFRVIKQVKPGIVVAENVYGLITRKQGLVFEQVCTDLESQNYSVQAFVIPACAINAPHKRDRVWIVAHSERNEQPREESCNGETRRMGRQFKSISWDRDWQSTLREFRGMDDGLSYGVDRVDTLRNAIVPQVAFEIFKAVESMQTVKK